MESLVNRIELLHDTRFAVRSLARSPGVTAVAVLVLVHRREHGRVLARQRDSLKPVPFAEPDRLVMLMLTANGNPFFAGSSPAQFVHFENTADTLEDVAAF
jgi:hypothetical protein